MYSSLMTETAWASRPHTKNTRLAEGLFREVGKPLQLCEGEGAEHPRLPGHGLAGPVRRETERYGRGKIRSLDSQIVAPH